ncbi:MAG: hypothetical protein HC808_13975 [Candidatus Competibacteraceae bacterium]|nr:hypothetical protein [Candidatus Competibacteraceae bacterium]
MNIYMSLPTGRVRAFSGDRVQQCDRDTIRAAGMLIRYTSVRLTMNATHFHQILTGFPNSLWFIALDPSWWRGGDGHVVAAQHDAGGGPHFFDPNYGHFHFADFARFRTWIDRFLVDSGYRRAFKYVKFFCVV